MLRSLFPKTTLTSLITLTTLTVFRSLSFVVLAELSLAADEVHTVDANGNEVVRRGEVVDYKGDNLTLKLDGGRETVIPRSRIKRIDADWDAVHQEADKRFAAREYDGALALYRQAFQSEKRRWVQRLLLSRVVRCQRNTARNGEACKNFARLTKDDPGTPYFDAIPLQWQTQPPTRDVRGMTLGWLRDADPVKQLLAGSWLLTSPLDRLSAMRVLKELRSHPDNKIATLAIGQFWRSELVTLREPQLAIWRARIDSMPIELRGGPYFLLGTAYARFNQSDLAALAFLRVPLMYADDVRLSQAAFLEGGKSLHEHGKSREAARLFQQAIALSENSAEGQRASELLRESSQR